jgi:hypothetical protein
MSSYNSYDNFDFIFIFRVSQRNYETVELRKHGDVIHQFNSTGSIVHFRPLVGHYGKTKTQKNQNLKI